ISLEDIACVRNFRPILEQHVDRLSTVFCQRVLSCEGALQNQAIAAIQPDLLAGQRSYLLSLGDPIDEAYAETRFAIGLMLRQIDLSPRWFLGGYSLYTSLLNPLIFSHFRDDSTRCEQTVQAFNKIFLLDIHLASQAYEQRNLEDVTELHRELTSERKGLSLYLEEHKILLRATKQRARAAEELATLSEFASGLAHEIGSPMNAILTHVELLESSVKDKTSAEWIGIIQEQIERITKIVRSFLDLTRPKEPEFVNLCLQEVIESALVFLKPSFERRRITVSKEFLLAPPQIVGDAHRLQQVLLNILANAADAMGDTGELRVAVVETGTCVCVQVEDDGHGIEESTLSKIFDPFFTTKTAGNGTGLGLVVANSIVEEHRGEIFVESQPGKGTTFHLCFPRAFKGAPTRCDCRPSCGMRKHVMPPETRSRA
ncbi:MAG: hypothetical protein JRC77_03020, partial [Deltaproteobacteria bacterium]|nr:hypothetical protein [Deltaproteobacteria bacterium]